MVGDCQSRRTTCYSGSYGQPILTHPHTFTHGHLGSLALCTSGLSSQPEIQHAPLDLTLPIPTPEFSAVRPRIRTQRHSRSHRLAVNPAPCEAGSHESRLSFGQRELMSSLEFQGHRITPESERSRTTVLECPKEPSQDPTT